jgi:4-alpha-glucanotransferase
MNVRSSGILLHITSLPSRYGIGDLGPGAYRFVDFLKRSKQSIWQLLPLTPTSMSHANSPYSSNSAFAGNPILISPDLLVEEGWIRKKDIAGDLSYSDERVDYHAVSDFKYSLLNRAFGQFNAKARKPFDYEQFCRQEEYWLDDFALFVALKTKYNGAVWGDWPWQVRDRLPDTLAALHEEQVEEITRQKFYQFLFFRQWQALKRYANDHAVTLFGDIPIYVNYDSSDVWTNPGIFKLNEHKKPIAVSGVPPDIFSATGQLWGNPVFDWDALRATGFRWWSERVRHNLKLFNLMRIDHFRGLIAYWEVDAHERTAVNGRWVGVPTDEFLTTLTRMFPNLPLVAEDLGIITPDVKEVMHRYGIPGMKVLLFAFFDGMEKGPYIPHNHTKESIIYTGTHDNNTVRGWFETEASEEDKKRIFDYVGREMPAEDIAWEFIRMAMMSVGNIIIVPMQDVLALGPEARMNRPATLDGNWEWRVRSEQLSSILEDRLRDMTLLHGRG